jgi:ubiquitin-protein ligase
MVICIHVIEPSLFIYLCIVYPDGRLCISILHPAGNDPISGEAPEVSLDTHTHENN